MLNEADLAATGLVQPASRISYRLAVRRRARDAKVAEFVDWAEAEIKAKGCAASASSRSPPAAPRCARRSTAPRNSSTSSRCCRRCSPQSRSASPSRDFAGRHLDDCAMLRVLGLSQRTIALQYLIEFALVGLLASVAGLVLGFVVHYVFVWLLAGLVERGPAAAGDLAGAVRRGRRLHAAVRLRPAAGAAARAGAAAARDPARRRRDEAGVARRPRRRRARLLGAPARGVARPQARPDRGRRLRRRGLRVRAAVVARARRAAPLGAGRARAALARSGDARRSPARPAFAVLQVSALAVGLLALVLLALLRTDLVSSWREATPKDAPNRFVINVQPPQADAFQAKLRASGVERYDWFPMIRGRLVAVAAGTSRPTTTPTPRARGWSTASSTSATAATLPAHNDVGAGRWTPDEKGALSVEEGLAETLGLKLGEGCASTSAARRSRVASRACARSTGRRCASISSSSFRPRRWSTRRSATSPPYRAPDRCRDRGFDNAISRDFPNITVDRRLGVDRAGASASSTRSSAPSSSCSASRSPPAWSCCSPRSARRASRAPASSP